jgi:hypothetical protein
MQFLLYYRQIKETLLLSVIKNLQLRPFQRDSLGRIFFSSLILIIVTIFFNYNCKKIRSLLKTDKGTSIVLSHKRPPLLSVIKGIHWDHFKGTLLVGFFSSLILIIVTIIFNCNCKKIRSLLKTDKRTSIVLSHKGPLLISVIKNIHWDRFKGNLLVGFFFHH